MAVKHDLEVFSLSTPSAPHLVPKLGTHMPTTIIIPQRLCTPKTLQQWIRRQHHLPNALDSLPALSRADRSDILHDPLRRFRLPCTGFPGNNNALVLLVGVHVVVGRFSDGEYVRGHFESVLAAVRGEDVRGVDAEVWRG